VTDKIPPTLQQFPQWVLWREEKRNANDTTSTKIPYSVNGMKAKPNDPTTWSNYATAQQRWALGNWSGLGFVFAASDPFCGIDLDGCRNPDTGKVEDWARQIIIDFASYSEISPSQTGIKIFIRGTSPLSGGRKVDLDVPKCCEKNPGIEVYDKLRYFAVTGQRVAGIPVEPQGRQSVLDRYCKTWFPVKTHIPTKPSGTDVVERASRYLAKLPPAISGESGHNAAFRAACVLVRGFVLPDADAYALLSDWNRTCEPPWSERELRHKLDSASKASGEMGYLRDVPQSGWAAVVIPTVTPPKPLPEKTTLKSAASDYITKIRAGELTLLKLGVADLDYAIGGGAEWGELIVIGARPGHGKSLIGLQMLYSASEQGIPSLMISEEMATLALGKRAIQFSSDVAEEEWEQRTDEIERQVAIHFSGKAPCYVVPSVGTAKRAIEAIRSAVAEDGVRCVLVDYVQLLQGEGNGRYEQVTNTSVALRHLATELKIIIIAICQLNRDIEKREKWMPRLGDLRDSGQIEQDADVILSLLWPHRLDQTKDPHEYLIFVIKNRSRETKKNPVKCEIKPSRQMIAPERDAQTREVVENRYWDNDKDDGGF
jgi:archaellum biogenesis ATPase FlaH